MSDTTNLPAPGADDRTDAPGGAPPASTTNDGSLLGKQAQPQGEAPQSADPQAAISYDELELPPDVDPAIIEPFRPIFQEARLPLEAVQRLVTTYYEQQANLQQAQVKAWRDAALSDPEWGKSENMVAAQRAARAFCDEELMTLFNSTGLGDHPAIIRAFAKIGKRLSEDRLEAGVRAQRPQTSEEAWAEFLANPEPRNQ